MKLKYFLDHPQIKRKKALGNGNSPKSSSKSTFLGGTKTSGQSGGATQTTKGGGTGNIKSNLGKLVSGK